MQKHRSLLVSISAGLAVMLSAANTFARQAYDITFVDFGGFGGGLYSINDAGQTVGNRSLTFAGDTTTGVFRDVDGTLSDLGTLGGDHTLARFINSAGTVVGNSSTGSTHHAFQWQQGSGMLDRGSGMDVSDAYCINGFGQTVGVSEDNANSLYRATLWQNGSPQFVGPPGVYSAGAAINDAGDIAGSTENGSGFQRVFVRSAGGFITIYDQTLGGTPWSNVYVTGMNNAGQIIGSSSLGLGSPYFGAFMLDTDTGTMTSLGSFEGTESQAFGINNVGDVVGKSLIGNEMHAFLWQDGVMINLTLALNQPGVRLYDAQGINNFGQIVGRAIDANGYSVGYILTPIPAPSTVSILFAPCAIVARRRR